MPPRPPPSPSLILAALLFLALAAVVAPNLGRVGEVDAAWALSAPPAVRVSLDPPTWADATRAPNAASKVAVGPVALEASQVRPVESVRVGPLRAPLAVNPYTGGLPDWPSRAVNALFGEPAVRVLHVLYGLVLLVLAWVVPRSQRAVVGAGAAVLWLASDWMFVFYRRILGGTEAWLVAGSLLVLYGLWDRRWRGGRHAMFALAMGLGIGLHAKITFVAVLAGLGVAALLTRWDRGALAAPSAPTRRALLLSVAVVLALLLPLVVAAVHAAVGLPDAPRLRSHDGVGLQTGRLLGGLRALMEGDHAPARESPANLMAALFGPLTFFERACGAVGTSRLVAGRAVGWMVVAVGTALAWRDARSDVAAPAALIRFLSIGVPAAAAAITVLNRDLHHLAMLSGLVAVWAGMSVERVAALATPPRSTRRGLAALLLLAPWLVAGVHTALATPGVLATCESPLLTRSGQDEVARLLRDHDVRRVVLADYDLYGALDMMAPHVQIENCWGALSVTDDRRRFVGDMVDHADGAFYLTTRASAPTIYGIRPSESDLAAVSERLGRRVVRVDALSDGAGREWATLYRVGGP